MEGVFWADLFFTRGDLGRKNIFLINQQHGFSARYIQFVPFDDSIFVWALRSDDAHSQRSGLNECAF